ncbi:MAG: sigma-70 family RNA polymerase sigma factor [Rhodanobacteraceae bacterium]|nr:sigma-70 family RNA polymerase sigma factor [Rhodanobacteraceae bacterium]
MHEQADLTGWLAAWHAGDRAAGERVCGRVYAELRGMAAGLLGPGAAGGTLQPTALVNEALIKLIGADADFDSRAHFFGAAARAMRQVLVDAARARQADKRGNGVRPEPLDVALDVAIPDSSDLLALDDALSQLELLDPQAARIVELRYFAGLSIDETAAALGLHASSAYREWQHARVWLKHRLDA